MRFILMAAASFLFFNVSMAFTLPEDFDPYVENVKSLSIPELQKLHDEGRTDATVQLARMLFREYGDTEKAIELLQKPAESGIASAQYLLGLQYRFNNRDLEKSLYWIHKAAANHSLAQETLAGWYEHGYVGLQKDPERAYALYRAAAEQGLKHSQMSVGLFLCKGIGTAINKKEGAIWFLKSQEGQPNPFSLEDTGCK